MNEQNITLSYILATRNKLPYLQVALPELITHKKEDEEIVVVDGASTDGSVEFLQNLLTLGKINQFISEPDKGEAHADNKAIMMARGALIKIITDDDAFHYPSIARCKEFMLAHPEIDILSTDGVKRRSSKQYAFTSMLYQSRFEIRQKRGTAFASCGLGLMMRASSLPIIGLLDTNFARVDAEYTLRTTAGKAKMAWFVLESYAHIRNSGSTSVKQERRITEEMERLEMLYFGASPYLPLKQKIRAAVRNFKERYLGTPIQLTAHPGALESEWKDLFTSSSSWLERNAKENRGEFLF